MRKRKLNENVIDRSDKRETSKNESLNQQFKLGDLTWVEIHDSSWWPAQVVDEDIVSDKPKKKTKNELLVRLYGTYQYMYVDASKSNSEFEEILKRENKTMKEKFQEAVEQDMSLMLPNEQSEPKSSKSKDIESAEASKDKKHQSELTKEPTGKDADEIKEPTRTEADDIEEPIGTEPDETEELTGKEADETEEPTGKEADEIEDLTGKKADEIKEPTGTEADETKELTGKEADETEEPSGKEADEIEDPTGKEADEIEEPTGKEADEIEELTGKDADEIVTVMKAATKKENLESSSMRKRKLDFSKEEREEREIKSGPSKAEAPYSKKLKVAKHAGTKNHGSSNLRQSPRVSSVNKASSTKSVVKAPISESEEVMKAKDLEIRKIVRDIIFGRTTEPPKDQSPKISKDAMQGDTSNAETSIINCQNAAEKTGLKATYYRKRTKVKQGDGEMKCKNRKNEGVKDFVSEVLETPNSRRDGSKSKKSNDEKAASNLPSRNIKGKGKAREDKTSHNEAQKSTLNSNHVEKKTTKGNPRAKSSESEVETPATVKDTATPSEEKGSLSERQVRVMQSLALIAPAGSPFGRNGFII